MEKRNKNKVVFSASGITPLRRFLEYDRKILENELGKKLSVETLQWDSGMSLDDFMHSGYFMIYGNRTFEGDSMPLPNSGSGNFVARLVVSSIVEEESDKNIVGQLLYAVVGDGTLCLKQRSRCGNECWKVWRNIISEEFAGCIDLSDFEKHLYSNSAAISAETTRATSAEEQLDEKIIRLDSLILRLNQKNFPLTVRLSHTPSTVTPQEYTGNETAFTLSWQCTVDGVSLSVEEMESVTISYNGETISLPPKTTSCTVNISDTTTVNISVIAQGMNATANTKISFGRRWFTGIVNSDFTITEDNIKSLAQQGIASNRIGTFTYSSFSLKRIVYVYAADYGKLSAIIDANNINLINNYTLSTVVVNGVEYNIYMTTEEFSVTGNITYKFQ